MQGALGHGPIAGLASHPAEGEVEAQPVNNGATLVAAELDMAFFQNAPRRVDVAVLNEILPPFFDPREIGGLASRLVEQQQ